MDPSVSSTNFVLRAYRGPEDLPAMNDVANAVPAFNGDPEFLGVRIAGKAFEYGLRTLPPDIAPARNAEATR